MRRHWLATCYCVAVVGLGLAGHFRGTQPRTEPWGWPVVDLALLVVVSVVLGVLVCDVVNALRARAPEHDPEGDDGD